MNYSKQTQRLIDEALLARQAISDAQREDTRALRREQYQAAYEAAVEAQFYEQFMPIEDYRNETF